MPARPRYPHPSDRNLEVEIIKPTNAMGQRAPLGRLKVDRSWYTRLIGSGHAIPIEGAPEPGPKPPKKRVSESRSLKSSTGT